jgi:NAD(P)-dependent dehydrogenase (short-subunit alcohol dehydrogenase family)
VRLADRVVVVTGGAQGIGRGIARRLAREGATIVIGDRNAAGQATVDEIASELGVAARFRQVNVGYEDQVAEFFAWIGTELGRVDVLVNNAQGFNGVAAIEDKTLGEYDYSLRTGLYASIWAMQAAFPYMRDQGGGSIVNLGSLDGIMGKPFLSDYDITKEAIRGLTKVAAREWGPHQIRVNCIAPSAMTAATERAIRQWDGFEEVLLASTPLGRIGDPEDDIGGVALFLASDDSRYVTGMTLYADGGMFLCPPLQPVVVDPSLVRPERRVQWVSQRSAPPDAPR